MSDTVFHLLPSIWCHYFVFYGYSDISWWTLLSISLVANNVDDFFMYSFPLVYLLVGSFAFLLLSFQSSLCILDTWQKLLGLHFRHVHHPPSCPVTLFHWNYSSWGHDCTLKTHSILTSSHLLALSASFDPFDFLESFFPVVSMKVDCPRSTLTFLTPPL